MKTINGEVVKSLREALSLTQEEFAEEIAVSVRTLYRIENNKSHVDVFQYMDMLSIFEKPLEDFFLLFLDNKAYQVYKEFREYYNRYVRNYQFAEFLDNMAKLKDSAFINSPYIQQILAFAENGKKTYLRKKNAEVHQEAHSHFNLEDLQELTEALSITMKHFDESKVADYLLTAFEVDLINNIIIALSNVKEHESAVSLAKELIGNKTLIATKLMNKYDILSMSAQEVLGYSYYQAKMYHDALDVFLKCYRDRLKTNSLNFVVILLPVIAECYKHIGEEEFFYKSLMVRAYYCSILHGYDHFIDELKQSTREIFNAELEDWIEYMPDDVCKTIA